MTLPQSVPSHERRKYPRYFVTLKMTMAIEDKSLQEPLGLAEPDDISLGGVRVRNLPACQEVKVGDHLELLLIDREDALSLNGEVVHHATPDTFGVEFIDLSQGQELAVRGIISRLHDLST
ncbi:MAG TPA: PilZ domain-containing protein [Pyrinomonadaceae bacterium]|nr:PilZ domain-containing protein [Pyrinomonadaceae bacterium]